MSTFILRAALVLVAWLAAPTVASSAPAAGDARVEALEARILALQDELAAVSRSLAQLRAERGAPAPESSAASSTAVTASTPVPATPPAATPPPAAVPPAASRVAFTADVRYRYDYTYGDADQTLDRERHRVRARVGARFAAHERVSFETGLSSGGLDPRNAYETLSNDTGRKELRLDLAYLEWRPTTGVRVQGGRTRQPWLRPAGTALLDSDLMPEGVTAFGAAGGFTAIAFHHAVQERRADDDAWLSGLQVTWRLPATSGLRVGAGYFDWHGVRERRPFFGADALGNSVAGSGLVYDYDVVEALAEYSRELAPGPLRLGFHYLRNLDAPSRAATAWSAAATLGNVSAGGRWELGYAWQSIDADALFAGWVDSDFGGGRTGAEGGILRAAYAVTPKITLSGSWFDQRLPRSALREPRYRRLQLDFTAQY